VWSGEPTAVIVPIELWRAIESERESAYLLKGETRAQSNRQFEQEREWLAENRDKFRGKWIALEREHLLAVGETAKEVFSKVSDQTPPAACNSN
jgi:Family of unknown function (DUF5678)